MTNHTNYKTGDIITYRNMGGATVRVLVREKDSNIKNGRPGFDGDILDSNDQPLGGDFGFAWGYDEQITNVEAR